jgi:hypothetical protein
VIQVCAKEGDSPFPRGNNRESKIKKIFFFRTSRPKSIKLVTNYSLVKRIQGCSNKWPGPLKRGDNHRNVRKG